jgi:hypothetical protein
MRLTATCWLFLLLLWTQGILASTSSYITFTTRTGDTVGNVLDSLGACPIWGKGNNMAKTVALNQRLIKKNGNYVPPNVTIKLPISSLPESSEYIITAENELFFSVSNPTRKCRPARGVAQIEPDESVEPEKVVATIIPLAPSVEDDNAHYGALRISTDFFYSALHIKDKATEDEADILSSVNRAYQFSWEQLWDENNRSFLFYRSEKHNYEAIENKLPETSFNLQGFGFGYERSVSDRLNLRFTVRMQEKVFMHAVSLSELLLDRAMIPEIGISPIYQLYARGPLALYADLGISYLGSSKTSLYDISSGYKYSMGISLTQKIKDFELLGRSFYNIENQDSSIMEKTTRELGLSFGVVWSFGK